MALRKWSGGTLLLIGLLSGFLAIGAIAVPGAIAFEYLGAWGVIGWMLLNIAGAQTPLTPGFADW
jgi:hypothetical protein